MARTKSTMRYGKIDLEGAKKKVASADKEAIDIALIAASQHGQLPAVEYLINNGANVNAQDKYGLTALKLASRHGHPPIVEYLINNGANINGQNNGETILIWASKNGHLSIVQCLISKGVNVNDRDKYGCTALISASSYGQLPVTEYLVSNGVNINNKNDYGNCLNVCFRKRSPSNCAVFNESWC